MRHQCFCDNCGKEDEDKLGLPVTLLCGYGSAFDGETFDFCSDECCAKFIISKLNEIKEKGNYELPLREKYKQELNALLNNEKN